MTLQGPLFRLAMLALCLFGATAACAAPLPSADVVFTTHPPTVDGILSEGEWKEAVPLFFPAKKGEPGTAEANSGEVRLLWTGGGLYVSLRALETTPVFGHTPPGQSLHEEDVFEIFFDAIGDQRQYTELQMDPAGNTFLKYNVLTAPPRVNPDNRLTPEFMKSDLWSYSVPAPREIRIASRIDPQTHLWTLEAFLPASFVNRRRGGKPLEPGTWRANFVRHDWDAPKGTPNRNPPRYLYWSPVFEGSPHVSPTAMGYLFLKK